jgi:hypothetical protein
MPLYALDMREKKVERAVLEAEQDRLLQSEVGRAYE